MVSAKLKLNALRNLKLQINIHMSDKKPISDSISSSKSLSLTNPKI